MKRFATPFLFVLVIVCLVAVVNWRSARSGLQATTSDLLTTSNRLAETTAQLATKAAAVETLRITQNLHAGDLTMLSNRLGVLAADLDKARLASRQNSEALRQRESELAMARAEIGKLKPAGEDLRAEVQAWQARLATAETKIKVEQQRAETLTATINGLQADKAIFHQRWNDPASLRAQLTWADRAKAANAGVMSAAKSTKLTLEADGSVTAVPVVFKDVPGPSVPFRSNPLEK